MIKRYLKPLAAQYPAPTAPCVVDALCQFVHVMDRLFVDAQAGSTLLASLATRSFAQELVTREKRPWHVAADYDVDGYIHEAGAMPPDYTYIECLPPTARLYFLSPKPGTLLLERDPATGFLRLSKAGKRFYLEAAYVWQGGGIIRCDPARVQATPAAIALMVFTASPFEKIADYFYTDRLRRCPPPCNSRTPLFLENQALEAKLFMLGARVNYLPLLHHWCEEVLHRYPPTSYDYNGALCVLGYASLGQQHPERLIDTMNTQLALMKTQNTPFAPRWVISLSFLLGLTHAACGQAEAAKAQFSFCALQDACDFAAPLCTKTIRAAMIMGFYHLASGDHAAAKPWFSRGITIASTLRFDSHAVGDMENPIAYSFIELAEVLKIGALCGFALNALANHIKNPGRHALRYAQMVGVQAELPFGLQKDFF